MHRHSLVHVLVIAPDRLRRLACAAEFHGASVLRSGPLVSVDCATEEPMLSRALLGWSRHTLDASGAHPLWAVAHGTLVLDRITRLSEESQSRLYELVRRPRSGSGGEWCGRLIATCDEAPEAAVAAGTFSGPLLDCLDKVRLDLRANPAAGAA